MASCLATVAGVLVAVWSARAALAHEGSQTNAAVKSGAPWSFTLPTLDGQRFVDLAEVRGPVLINFWGVDCPPCVAELPLLDRFSRDNPQWTVLLVGTDAPPRARKLLQQLGVTHSTALKPGANVVGLMRLAGNRSGGLPFSVVWNVGAICDTRAGTVEPELLVQWQKTCTAPTRP